jgi:hypothetical protein
MSTDTLRTFRMERRKKNFFTLRMKAIRSVETSVTFYRLITRNITEDTNPHQYIFEDTISYLHYVFVLRVKAYVPHVRAVIQLPNVRYTFYREEKGMPENLTL